MRINFAETKRLVKSISHVILTRRIAVAFIALVICIGASRAAPNFISTTERPLRYTPDGLDFVIENGPELFNRPLYIRNSAMRVDAGDRPEFSFYGGGRMGNLRLGVRVGSDAKWLTRAANITARYRPAEMLYEIRDPLLGDGVISVHLLTLSNADGIIARVEARDISSSTELLIAFGGIDGARGRRNGDINCEPVPVSELFSFKPERCLDNVTTLDGMRFTVKGPRAALSGIVPQGATISIGDASTLESPADLVVSKAEKFPVIVAVKKLDPNKPEFVIIQKEGESVDAVSAYEQAAARAKAIRERVVVDTPDPFINAAVAALNVATDGVWDEQQGAVMHGAVAWRNKLLGWRGPYANDALGWHDRAKRHFTYWAGRQNTKPVPATQPGPDASANLARSEDALHSNGDMSGTHYDMNLVYVDALFRHLMWTGDMKMARDVWPMLMRHFAWEKRLFRREVGPEKLPLYEGYCCIWASDDLWYSGGGATHSSAYNYHHNRTAAKLARALGEDPAPFDKEADLIWRGMQEYLWVKETGCFAEWKDLLGKQLVHPAAALWTIYHTIDSNACTPEQAMSMTKYVDRTLSHIPIHGPGIPDEGLYTLPTTNWMPYTWSTNNVVMAEAAHTSLAFWQAGRGDEAFKLFKGLVIDSMYQGLCPGNVGMATKFDMARNESQRDFADGAGATSRALIEGLFGIKPDAIIGELVIQPGFPAKWDRASIRHPDLDFSFKRDGSRETFVIEQKFSKPMKVRVKAQPGDTIASATVNGSPVQLNDGAVEVQADASARSEVVIVWKKGPVKQEPAAALTLAKVEPVATPIANAPAISRHDIVDLSATFNDHLTKLFVVGKYLTPRSPFCSLSLPTQGIGSWCHPLEMYEVDDSGLRRAADQGGGKITLPNGTPLHTPGVGDAKNIAFVSQWDNQPKEIEIPLTGNASRATLLMAGTTNSMQSRFDNGEVIVTYADGSTARLALHNPTTWWPIDQDYLIDDFAFARPEPLPIRIDLATGKIRVLEMNSFKGKGGKIKGGAATVLEMPLDASKPLKSLQVKSIANDVIIGLMSVTLGRP